MDNEDSNILGRLSYWCSDVKAARRCEEQEGKEKKKEGGRGERRTQAEAT